MEKKKNWYEGFWGFIKKIAKDSAEYTAKLYIQENIKKKK